MHVRFYFENVKERDHLEDLGLDGRTISERFLGKYSAKV